MSPSNLLDSIVAVAVPLSSSIAHFLQESEAVRDRSLTAAQLLEREESWRVGEFSISRVLENVKFLRWDDLRARASSWEKRLASLVVQDWSMSGSRSARQPDVLSLTISLLSSPSEPHTREIVRYAIVLAIRSLYRVENEPQSLADLLHSYSDLAPRVQGQQRRRQRRAPPLAESFLLDLLCMEGFLYRALLRQNWTSYCESFKQHPLGVDRGSRHFPERGKLPEIHGSIPDFATILNLSFNQPTGIPGLDDITGGFMPTMAEGRGVRTGGIVTLLAGAPGTGKTTLAMSLASRMAELGSQVVYLSAEERRVSLSAKQISVVESNRLSRSLWPDATLETLEANFRIEEDTCLRSLRQIADQIGSELSESVRSPLGEGDAELGFPYVVVIDSITVLTSSEPDGHPTFGREREPQATNRQDLASVLNELRRSGACVILIGERTHMHDHNLAYLVDNVLLLELEEEPTSRHPVRLLSVEKTRLQASYRGRHVFHLSRRYGPSISPSLHAVLKIVSKGHLRLDPHRNVRLVLWSSADRQRVLPGLAPYEGRPEQISVRAGSHSLIYGWGSSGKAKLALGLALKEPTQIALDGGGRSHSQNRTLIVSFLYDEDYYHRIVLGLGSRRSRLNPRECLVVLPLYPGYLDPETLIERVRRSLRTAQNEGRPFQSVVIDGIHNMLLQFPLLARETLLWPTLFRLLQSEGVTVISTFTFFHISRPLDAPNSKAEELSMVPSEAERMFHHLLVSNCDYTFLVAPLSKLASDGVSIIRTSSSDGLGKERDHFFWDGSEFHLGRTAEQ